MSSARQAAWALVGVGGQQVIRFLILIVLARLLEPAAFGVIAAAQILLALADTFSDFGIGLGLLRAKTVDRETERSAMSVVLISTALLAGVIALSSHAFATLLRIPEVEAILPWLALAFFLQSSSGPMIQLMFRNGRFREVSLIQLVTNGIFYACVSVALAALGWGYWAIVAGSVAQSLSQFLLLFALHPITPTLRLHREKLRPILHFGLGILAGHVLNTVARRADNAIAGRFLGAGGLGLYSRAYAIMDLANQLPGVIFGRVFMPHFARKAHSEAERERSVEQFYLSHVAAAAIMLPATVVTVLLAHEIIAILLGNGWEAAAPVLQILGLGLVLRLGYKVSSTVVLAYGDSWKVAAREGVYAAMVLVGAYVGSSYGLEGIAAAVLLALLWQFAAHSNLAFETIGGSWSGLGRALSPVVLATAAGAITGSGADIALGHQTQPWLPMIVVGGAVAAGYLAILWLFLRSHYVAAVIKLPSKMIPKPRAVRAAARVDGNRGGQGAE
jgi:PST family polysaccharide transporter